MNFKSGKDCVLVGLWNINELDWLLLIKDILLFLKSSGKALANESVFYRLEKTELCNFASIFIWVILLKVIICKHAVIAVCGYFQKSNTLQNGELFFYWFISCSF